MEANEITYLIRGAAPHQDLACCKVSMKLL